MNKTVRSVIAGKQAVAIIAIVTGLLVSYPSALAQEISSYHNYNDLTRELQTLVAAHKSLARIESIGKSIEGRDIWVVTLGNPAGTPMEERPGMLIGANFEGDHLIGSEISLSVIRQLLNSYGTDEDVKRGLDEHVFYIFPRVNPDGAERMFEKVKTGLSTNRSDYDGDNDGRMDEDGPEDLNNDGLITLMRVKDPNGQYMISEEEPRLIRRADPKKGEAGTYSVYWEGIDNDKDGFINEDPDGGVDINRNFMHAYPYFSEDAGWHMVSENESIALMAWIIEHRNIAIILNFGKSDNLVVSPNAKGLLSSSAGVDMLEMARESYSDASKVGMITTGNMRGFGFGFGFRPGRSQDMQSSVPSGRQRPARSPETTVNQGDQEYFRRAGEVYRELTGIKTQPPLREPEGAFFQYGYYQFGVLSLSTPGWGLDQQGSAEEGTRSRSDQAAAEPSSRGSRMAGGARPASQGGAAGGTGAGSSLDEQLLKYIDTNGGDGFVEWKPFNHPELGELEIGGFSPFHVSNPSGQDIDALGKSHAEFVTWLAGLYAEVKIAKTEVINHGGGLFRIKAEVENCGFLPTSLAQGVTSRSVKPTMVQLGVEPESIISGHAKTNFIQTLDGSGNRQKFEWLISGKEGDKVDLKVVAQKAGSDKVTIILK